MSPEERWQWKEELAREYKARAGWFFLGAYDELIAGYGNPPVPGALLALRDGDGLLLRDFEDRKAPPFGRVSANGKLQIFAQGPDAAIAAPPNEIDWPVREKVSVGMPPPWTIIKKPDAAKAGTTWISTPPPGTEGWAVLLKDGGLLFMPPDTKPFENILWVVRTGDDGLDFIHAGPAREGLYMHVAKDRLITWTDSRDARPGPPNDAPRWPYLHETRNVPALRVLTGDFGNCAFLPGDYPNWGSVIYQMDDGQSVFYPTTPVD